MSHDDTDLERSVARIGGRIEARRRAVREKLATRPELLAVAEACKETFQARLLWISIGDWEDGNPAALTEVDGKQGVIVPVSPPLQKRRGRKHPVTYLRELEEDDR